MERKHKPTILIVCDYYLPGYKNGGGMRTLVNLVDRFHAVYDFRIITRDHDGKLDRNQYETVDINKWNEVRNAQVFYLSKNNITITKMRELILNVNPDLIYANSHFSTLSIFVVILRKLKVISKNPMIIAPCGEFSSSALNIKGEKKRVYLFFSRILNLYQNYIWKASSEIEKNEILNKRTKTDPIFIAPDLPPKVLNKDYKQENKPLKRAGKAKLIFLSRFVRIKNFKWLLQNMSEIKGELEVDIYGPLEDYEYWQECKALISKLPENIKVVSKGGIPYEETEKILLEHNFFISPTLSENFGHVFLEAMASGCPLIISNRTPWLNLEQKGIGWDLELEKPQKWIEVLNRCLAMGNEEYQKISSTARSFAVEWLKDKKVEKETGELLEYALQKHK